MSIKIKHGLQLTCKIVFIMLGILVSSYVIDFIMQLGRILGTLIRIIMNLS